MKKWLGILGMLMILAGCQDSTSDVAVVGQEKLPAMPDTVITNESLTIEMYLPANPFAIEIHTQLETNAGVQMGMSLLAKEGFSSDGTGALHTRAIDAEGRVLEATWFPVTDSAGVRFAMLGHFRTENSEFVIPLRNPTLGDPPLADAGVLVPDKKGEWRPSMVFDFGGCLAFYRALFQACMGACASTGLPPKVCFGSCLMGAAAAFVACIFFTVVHS